MFTIQNSKKFRMALAVAGLVMGGSVIVRADEPIHPAPGVKVVAQEGDYCHLQFPAIKEGTMGTNDPQLKDWSSGDIVDYYGPCDHDPAGKDESSIQTERQMKDWIDDE